MVAGLFIGLQLITASEEAEARQEAERRAAVPGHRPAGQFLKPLRRADPLRHNAGADLFRHRLRHATKMVAARADRLHVEYSDLSFCGAGVVEDSVMVVI
jgi:hypothetical protein